MWVVVLIVGGLAVSAACNGIIHAIFFLTGGKMDDGDE